MDKSDWDEAFAWADDASAGPAPNPDDVPEGEPLRVWPSNWDVACLFLKCETQWATWPSGRFKGLDYAGVDVVMARNTKLVADADEVFAQLQVMELAALGVLNG